MQQSNSIFKAAIGRSKICFDNKQRTAWTEEEESAASCATSTNVASVMKAGMK
jgi:hypothetical protein